MMLWKLSTFWKRHWIRNRRTVLFYKDCEKQFAPKGHRERVWGAWGLDQQINPVAGSQTPERCYRSGRNRKRRIGNISIVVFPMELHAVLSCLNPLDAVRRTVERHARLMAGVHNSKQLHLVRIHLYDGSELP